MSMTEALEMISCRSRSSSLEVHALFNFFVSVSPGTRAFTGFEQTRACRSGLQGSIAPAFTAFIATHLGAELIERHGAEHRDPLTEHLERQPDGALAALAADPRVTLGFELGNGAAVCHRSRRRANRAIAVSPTKKRSSHRHIRFCRSAPVLRNPTTRANRPSR
jgi:hypothetical protein